MKISFSNKIAAAAAAGLISAACGGSAPEAESPSGELENEAGDAEPKGESCKGENGCEHKGECKGEESAEGKEGCEGKDGCEGKEGCDGHAPE